ncbi:MAG: flavin reductase family protein [Candidatus Rokubacteria bacterium]|nr:flavin reductase family protein [Candidatus Rokubacteria bacterium]
MSISTDEFRHVLSHFASGVTVVTTWDAEGRPTGLTVSAFTSVSLEPPLVLVCVDHKAQSYPALRASSRFAVNILAAEHRAVSERFATTNADKFAAVTYQPGPLGLPLLPEALAHLECRTVSAYPGGDHTIFVGEVESAQARQGNPLLYFRGSYSRLFPLRRRGAPRQAERRS